MEASVATTPADSIGPFPWRPRGGDVAGIAVLFALSRVVLVVVGMVAWGHQIPSQTWRGKDRSGIRYALVPEQPFLDMWTRWDSWEYEEIARQGYWFDINFKPRPYGTVACFPFYPLVIRCWARSWAEITSSQGWSCRTRRRSRGSSCSSSG